MTQPQRQGKGIDSFALKVIAIIGMTMDHAGIIFTDYLSVPAQMILFAPGGLTFPIMAYLLTVGYRHTRDFKRYALRLLAFALVSFVPFSWMMGRWYFNVLFTLLLGLVGIYLYDHMQSRAGFWLAFAGLTLLSVFCDWNLIGVPMILCYHAIQGEKLRVVVPVLFPWGLMVLPMLPALALMPEMIPAAVPQLLYVVVGCTATIPLLLSYNGERGRPMKYFFYVYYPLHLAVLCSLRYLLFGVLWPA